MICARRTKPWYAGLQTQEARRLMVYSALYMAGTDFILLAVKPAEDAIRPWRRWLELLLVLCGGVALIFVVSNMLMRRACKQVAGKR